MYIQITINLVKKKFLNYTTYGKVREYFPTISKEAYFRRHFKDVIGNFFSGSTSNFARFFTADEQLDVRELEDIKALIEDKIRALKKQDE